MQQVNKSQQVEEQMSIPVKITQSIFMSDGVIAQDIEWLTINQITHIINCAGKQCQNNTQIKGMSFLTFDWSENTIQNIIDQNIINASIGFIEEARKQYGTVLIHGFRSQTRPFCIISIYLMIKYQWSIYKTLDYLNSRKEETQVDSLFFQQLNLLHGKLQQKGMIKSKLWVVTPEMSEEELLITNTYLNSKMKNGNNEPKVAKSKRRKINKSICWKDNATVQHTYSQNTMIAHLNMGRPLANQRMLETKQRSDSVNSRKNDTQGGNSINTQSQQKSNKSIASKILVAKQTQKSQKHSSILTEMNVTKKWTELRQSCLKVSRSYDTPLYVKKEQKINDRLQDKLNILKNQSQETKNYQPSVSSFFTEEAKVGKKIAKQNAQISKKEQKELTTKQNTIRQPRQSRQAIGKQNIQTQKENSKTVHNNWIINNQILKDPNNKNQKTPASKSVIMVKPNHALTANQFQSGSRSSIRKAAGSQKKNEKDELKQKNFFDNEVTQYFMQKGRSNSVKQQRRELGNSLIVKNSSLIGKGKWKM